MEQSSLCSFGSEQTIKHIAEECPITKFERGIVKILEAQVEAINWLNSLQTPF